MKKILVLLALLFSSFPACAYYWAQSCNPGDYHVSGWGVECYTSSEWPPQPWVIVLNGTWGQPTIVPGGSCPSGDILMPDYVCRTPPDYDCLSPKEWIYTAESAWKCVNVSVLTSCGTAPYTATKAGACSSGGGVYHATGFLKTLICDPANTYECKPPGSDCDFWTSIIDSTCTN